MNIHAVARTTAAAAVALLIAGCGGGGSSTNSGTPTTTASLQVSGTAATGAALADAAVQVKCATGTGTATTSTSGGYTVTVEGGALPCLVKVSGLTATGVEITLHSVTEAGTSADGTTKAVANVSPITEMIVAQLTAALPSASFESFDLAQINTASVTQAATAVVNALQAVGIDLTNIDPLKSALVPPTGTTAGNAYDDALEKLGETVTPEALPLLVTQIAAAAATGSTDGATTVVTSASGGTLEGCPSALSGKYRTLDYAGGTTVRAVDFKNKTFMSGNGVDAYTITVDAANPCAFTASGTINGTTSEFKVVFGPNGVGAYRAQQTAPSVTPGVTGYIFPVQTHAVGALAGSFSFLESGFDPDEGWIQWMGEVTVSGANAQFCDYDKAANWGCAVDSQMTLNLVERSDGGFDLNEGSVSAARLYGYLAPNGAMTVFGTTNPTGATGSTVKQTTVVISKRATLPVRSVGDVTKGWDTDFIQRPPAAGGRLTVIPTAQNATVTAVDTATGAVTRKRESDGRIDTIYFNKPLPGLLQRDAGSFVNSSGTTVNFPGVYVFPLSGLGISIGLNQVEAGFTFPNGPHIYSLSVQRPQ